MSRFFYYFSKTRPLDPDKIESIEERILPAKVKRRERYSQVSSDGREALVFYNPTSSLKIEGMACAVGSVFSVRPEELVFGNEKPRSFSFLLRTSGEKTEAFTDLLCSKSIWYFADNERFIISDSQRALVHLLGNFEMNEQARSWFLATGTTGPGNAWDRRLRWVRPNGSLVFDKISGRLEERFEIVPFEKKSYPDDFLGAEIRRLLEDEFSNFNFDPSFFITLSGGTDSRLLAALLKKYGHDVATVTWGIPEKREEPNGDIFLARKTADLLGLENRFMPVGPEHCELDFRMFLNKCVELGEGRIDQISGYLDGFTIWETLANEGFMTCIRGDEVFGGRQKLYSESHLRQLQTLHGLEVYDNFKPLPAYDLPDVVIPEYLDRAGDTMETWRDRLFNYANLGTVQASLNDFKYPFTDLVNPLLLNELVYLTRKFSDEQRTAKILFSTATKSYVPDLPTAYVSTLGPVWGIFQLKNAGQQATDILTDPRTRDLVGAKLLQEISPEKVKVTSAPKAVLNRSLKRKIRSLVPHNLLKFFKNQKAEILPPQRMALRVCMIRATVEMYKNDACGC